MVHESLQIKDVPLVNSKSPLKKLETRAGSKFNECIIGLHTKAKKENTPTLFNSLITTEKNIINPAILIIVLMDDVIAFVNTFMMLELEILVLQFEFTRYCFLKGQLDFRL